MYYIFVLEQSLLFQNSRLFKIYLKNFYDKSNKPKNAKFKFIEKS